MAKIEHLATPPHYTVLVSLHHVMVSLKYHVKQIEELNIGLQWFEWFCVFICVQ